MRRVIFVCSTDRNKRRARTRWMNAFESRGMEVYENGVAVTERRCAAACVTRVVFLMTEMHVPGCRNICSSLVLFPGDGQV